MSVSFLEIKPLPHYHPHLGCLFESFAQEPWAIWLDSGKPGSLYPVRYEIATAFPIFTFTTRGDRTFVQDPHGKISVETELPFQLLNHFLSSFLSVSDPDPIAQKLPFIGGLMGYFGYDLGKRLEVIPSIATADIDLPDMAVGCYGWAFITDHQEKQTYWVENPTLTQVSPDWPKQKEKLLKCFDNPFCFPALSSKIRLKTPFKSNLDEEAYLQKLSAVKEHLLAGDCYQINLAQRFTAEVAGSPWIAYQQIRQKFENPYAAFMQLGSEQAILCHSPERFLRLDCNRWVETKPIKGTRRRSLQPEEDKKLAEALLASPKDRAENVMIVDLLRNDLGKVCEIGSVTVPKLAVLETFPTVHHLVSTVVGKLKAEKTALDLLQACFPGGSITGAPKCRSMQIIESLEPHRRSVYCGSMGYIDIRGRMDTNIAIRTLLWDQGKLHAYAGGGIVIDSVAAEEYQETFDKIGPLLAVLASGN